MLFKRKIIAVFLLALLSCQLVLASVADPCTLYSELAHSQEQNSEIKNDLNANNLDSNSLLLVLADQECEHCCTSFGHCHMLSMSTSAQSLPVVHAFTLTSSYNRNYTSLSFNLLHRPPIRA